MKTHAFEIRARGLTIELRSMTSSRTGHVLIICDDDVSVVVPGASPKTAPALGSVWQTPKGFPPDSLTEETIVDILRERGGSAKITDRENGWNIYDELAARLGVSWESRNRLTPGTGEPAWRPEVGYCRKHLEQAGVIEPTEKKRQRHLDLEGPQLRMAV